MELTPAQHAVLEAVCESYLPPVEHGDGAGRSPLWEITARNGGLTEATLAAMSGGPRPVRYAVSALADELITQGFVAQDNHARTATLQRLGQQPGQYRLALRSLRSALHGMMFGRLDQDGSRNSLWSSVGFPGPVSAPPSREDAPRDLPVLAPGASDDVFEVQADVCIVGSGAGGSVIAARLAEAGRTVVVLEKGPYNTEADMPQLESVGSQMFLNGGLFWSVDGRLGVLAGSALGGGTVINSMVCLRPPMSVRTEWADLGLDGLDTAEFDEHLDRVWTRLGVNTTATVPNRNSQLMMAGLEATGHQRELIPRNAKLTDDNTLCGYCNSGCQQGMKVSTTKSYLEDAAEHGAQFVVGAVCDRVLVEDGRAVGVQGSVSVDGRSMPMTVRAPAVVVACGGVESPALLLRSGIGGPAVGQHLRVHPAWIVSGEYAEPVDAWNGQIQSIVSFDFAHAYEGSGFLVETLGLSPSLWASQPEFTSSEEHRASLERLPQMTAWHGVAHDTGSAQVTLDADGRAQVEWAFDDPTDQQVARAAHLELTRMHIAAGAQRVLSFGWENLGWSAGESFDDFEARVNQAPAESFTAYSAHQMGSCRLGSDPTSSVAGPTGELHDVQGVWIGDASALPSAPGVNPMITIMAMAERTAARMLAQ